MDDWFRYIHINFNENLQATGMDQAYLHLRYARLTTVYVKGLGYALLYQNWRSGIDISSTLKQMA